MQIRVIEHNDNEGETFSYILEVSEERAEDLKSVFDTLEPSEWQLEMDTNYTIEKAKELNNHVNNGYMDYIGFYAISLESLEDITFNEEWIRDTFYKGNGLIEL